MEQVTEEKSQLDVKVEEFSHAKSVHDNINIVNSNLRRDIDGLSNCLKEESDR